MIVCIVAGGSGTRLWPISTSDYPKHLIKVNGDEKSLLQNTYERARRLSDTVYVVTETGHAHHIKDQLSGLSEDRFIIEPARRGTANCIIAALEYIGRIHGGDEVVAMIHADHFIRDVVGFSHSFRVAESASKKTGRVVLVGVEPDHPATGFGYIKKDTIHDEANLVYNVDCFVEKPDYNKALSYVRSGKFLWNCGYFVGSVNTFEQKMQSKAPELYANYQRLKQATDQQVYNDTYLSFENEAIDYALMELLDDLLVVPASFDWMDLGSFGDLHKAVGGDQDGNYTRGDIELDGVENSYIENNGDVPVAVIGLDNVVVINTKDGILVARKDLGQKVGEVAKKIAKRDSPTA